jgi:cytokinin dehydrogenase
MQAIGVKAVAGGGCFADAPPLDGELLLGPASRAAVAGDLGGIVSRTPGAVLRPRSIDDVAAMVRFCQGRRIKVATRGQGHSTHGQGQVEDGLLIDLRTLAAVHEVGRGFAVVDGGATWRTLLETTLASGQTPPVLTGFIGLSIGGTLSMGGISGMAYDKGVQVEHVLELTVVTGQGRIEVCSRLHNQDLFDAVLAGIGQYGIIVRAKVALVRAEARALDHTLRYQDLRLFLADMRTLVERRELDMVWGGFKRDATGWFYELYTTRFYTPPHTPPSGHLLRGLSFDPASPAPIDGTYLEYQTRVDGLIAQLRSLGVWDGFMHPWFDVFLPDSQLESYVEKTLASLAPEDLGNFGFVLLFPLLTATIRQPLFRLPNERLVFLFDLLGAANAPGFDAAFAERMLARNRTLFEAARAVGGTRYPIGTQAFTPADWEQHYGPEWERVLRAKALFDPDHILTPGPGLFL